MKGTAKSVTICGSTVKLGDNLIVEYTKGDSMKGGSISGEVIELWNPNTDNGHLQGRLSCGWCFHDHDKIVRHTKGDE